MGKEGEKLRRGGGGKGGKGRRWKLRGGTGAGVLADIVTPGVAAALVEAFLDGLRVHVLDCATVGDCIVRGCLHRTAQLYVRGNNEQFP